MKKTKHLMELDDWNDEPIETFHADVAQGVIDDEDDLDTSSIFLVGFTAG